MNKLWILILFILFFSMPVSAFEQDSFIEESLAGRNIEKPFQYSDYNFQSVMKVPIHLKIMEEINSEQDLYEGQVIKFIVTQTAKYNGKIIAKAGTIVYARVETIIANGMNGIPASIIIGSFKIPNIEEKHLTFYYEKYGCDLSLLVFPIKWMLTPLYPMGSLTNFIKGGHAKINQNTKITIYYYP